MPMREFSLFLFLLSGQIGFTGYFRAFNELQNFLQSNDGYTLSIANAIFYQNGFLSGKLMT